MLFMEIIPIYNETHNKHTDTQCGLQADTQCGLQADTLPVTATDYNTLEREAF